MKTATMRLARRPPSSTWSLTSSKLRLMNFERSRTISKRMSWGSPFWISSSFALMRSTTATVFVPDCLRMTSETAFRPLRRASVRASSSPSTTIAMSRMRTGPVLRSATISSSNPCGDSIRPRVRTPSSRAPPVSRPPGISTFWRASASFTCWIERL